MKQTFHFSILFAVALLMSCCYSRKSATPEYTLKKITALDQFHYDYNGYHYNAYMCYFGDNTGFARVFVLQYATVLGYLDTWFEIRINDTFDGLIYSPTDESLWDSIPFLFEISKTNNYSVCHSLDGYVFPIRVRPVDKNDMHEVLSSVRVPLELNYPNK